MGGFRDRENVIGIGDAEYRVSVASDWGGVGRDCEGT